MPLIILYVYVYAFLPLCLLSLVLAWRWGGTTERIAAWSFVIATLAQQLGHRIAGPAFSHFEPLMALIDAALFGTLLWLSFGDPRRWLLIASALQLLSLLGHFARLMTGHMMPLAYAILMGSGGYPTQFLLIGGIIAFHRRHQKRLPSAPRI